MYKLNLVVFKFFCCHPRVNNSRFVLLNMDHVIYGLNTIIYLRKTKISTVCWQAKLEHYILSLHGE